MTLISLLLSLSFSLLATPLLGLASADSIPIPRFRITELGHISGGLFSYAKGINNSGDVVGFDYLDYPANAIYSEISAPRAFLYDGTMHDLGALGGDVSAAWEINDAGQVVGAATLVPLPDDTRQAFFYDGTMHDLGTLGGPSSAAFGLNNKGQVVGTSNVTVNHHAAATIRSFIAAAIVHQPSIFRHLI